MSGWILLLMGPAFGADEPWVPEPDVSWDYQISDAVEVRAMDRDAYILDIYDEDRIKAAANLGKQVICYFSAGTWEKWRVESLRPWEVAPPEADMIGEMKDWNELWLDIRKPGAKAMSFARIDQAALLGCKAVEFDNMDAYDNEGAAKGGFTIADSAAYFRELADHAHAKGLSVALKNAMDIADYRKNPKKEPYAQFADFFVNESCVRYNECDRYDPHDKPVLHVEYVCFNQDLGDPGAEHFPDLEAMRETLTYDAETGDPTPREYRRKFLCSDNSERWLDEAVGSVCGKGPKKGRTLLKRYQPLDRVGRACPLP